MIEKPDISVVMPVFNRIEFLKPAIESVIEQTFCRWELILVDDGSENCVIEYLNNITDKRVRLIRRNRQPKGAPVCRNIGWQNASSDLILFLDSDDLLAPWCIKERIEFIKNKLNYSLYIFEGLEFDNENPRFHRLRTLYKTENPLLEFLNFQSCWQTSCVVWKKNVLQAIGGWDESVLSWQDGEVHIRALFSGITYCWCNPLPDVFIRRHLDNNRISSTAKSVEKYKNLYKTYKNIEGKIDSVSLKKHFKKNYRSLLFSFTEGLSREIIPDYSRWIKDEFGNSMFAITLRLYASLQKHTTIGSIDYRIIYQLRKIGIPNKRRKFWTKRPILNKENRNLLCKKFRNHKFIKNQVLHLSKLCH